MKKKYLTSLLVVIIYYNFFLLNADENYLNNKEKNYEEHSYSELKLPKSRLLIQKKNENVLSKIMDGVKPDPNLHELDPGEYRHGWQFHAANAREVHFREHDVLE